MQYGFALTSHVDRRSMYTDCKLPAINAGSSDVTEDDHLRAALEAVPGVERISCRGHKIDVERCPLFDWDDVLAGVARVVARHCRFGFLEQVEMGSCKVAPPAPSAPETEIRVGMVVTLRSGGPRMTVIELIPFEGDIAISCAWFESDGSAPTGRCGLPHREPFPAAALAVAPGPADLPGDAPGPVPGVGVWA